MPQHSYQERSESILFLMLLLYLVGRILQLFAGRLPNLVIVTFHVIPAALFALIHGARVYRLRGILAFISLCLGVATFFESLSLRTGFPFGQYEFTGLMGPKIAGLPVLLALAYVGMGYLSWTVSAAIDGVADGPLSGGKIILLPLLASTAMTAWDLAMDPIWADIDHGWIWHDGGAYDGVPISNFFGWLFTTYVFYQLFALYLQRREVTEVTTNSPRYRPLAVAFYALSALGNLLVIAPSSLGNVFVDASGRSWPIDSILWKSRLVSVFVMLPLSLLAGLKILRQARSLPPHL